MKKIKLKKSTIKKIVIAEAVILVGAVALVFAMTPDKPVEKDLQYDESALSAEALQLKEEMDAAKTEEDEAYDKMTEAKAELGKADRKLLLHGKILGKAKDEANEAAAAVAREEKKYLNAKANVDENIRKTKDQYVNCGKYFLNSKATTSVEYWTAKARAYSGTAAAANSGLFSSALADALTYDHLMTASHQIDKSNSLGGVSRKIDYNLMTSAAVSVAVYTANHSLTHTFAWKVIGNNYGPWSDENLAYGMGPAQAWIIWYDNERANNGPHFRNIRNSGRTTTGYGYTVKGSPAPSHAQEFGVNGSGAVLTTPAQFRADLTKFRDDAKKKYDEALVAGISLKDEPPELLQARILLNHANAKLREAGDKIGVDYPAILEEVRNAENDYKVKHKAYLKARKAFMKAAGIEEE